MVYKVVEELYSSKATERQIYWLFKKVSNEIEI